MLLLLWWAATSLAMALGALMGPPALAVAGAAAAQSMLVAGAVARLPAALGWPAVLAFATAGGLTLSGTDLVVYAVLLGTLLAVTARFAHLAGDLSRFVLPSGDPAPRRTLHTTTLADPVAREFARARRAETHLAVASIALDARAGGSRRRLAEVARRLVPTMRRTDAIVRAAEGRLVVVLPDADEQRAELVLGRIPADVRDELLIGTAIFPQDGTTWEYLRDVARQREGPRAAMPGAAPAPAAPAPAGEGLLAAPGLAAGVAAQAPPPAPGEGVLGPGATRAT